MEEEMLGNERRELTSQATPPGVFVQHENAVRLADRGE